MTPAISVVLAVYNGERYLEQAVRSVLSQSLPDFELIVVDDGSTDSTPDLLQALSRTDERIVVLRQRNAGLAASLNRGIGLAKGAYVARQDADDVSCADRFARQFARLKADGTVAAIGTCADIINESGAVIGRLTVAAGAAEVRHGLLTIVRTPVHGSMMIRRRALEATGGYREAFRTSQDYDLWLRMASSYDLDNLPDVLYQWRLAPGSVHTARQATQLKYAGLARALAEERLKCGEDSYERVAACRGNLDAFVEDFRLGGYLLGTWGDLYLRSLGNSKLVRQCLRRALWRGDLRLWTACLAVWTHLGLPWPGSKPLTLPDGGQPESTPPAETDTSQGDRP